MRMALAVAATVAVLLAAAIWWGGLRHADV